MKTEKLLIILLLFPFGIYAQHPINKLIKQRKGEPQISKELKAFKNSGIQNQFNYGTITREQFIEQAKTYLGTPYKYGGYSKSGIDCSGFISKTFKDLGVEMPHSVQEMAKFGKIILDKNELQAGDLIFFTKTYKTKKLISHAGIVVADAKMIHASSSKGVSITNIHNPYYWDKYYLFGTRIFEKGLSQPAIASTESPSERITKVSYKEKVIASVYDIRYKGKYTDNGERYLKRELTASHPTLPFGTKIKVTNLSNNKSVIVRINDGDSGRDEIDLTLSKKAARKLRIIMGETAEVNIKVIKVGK